MQLSIFSKVCRWAAPAGASGGSGPAYPRNADLVTSLCLLPKFSEKDSNGSLMAFLTSSWWKCSEICCHMTLWLIWIWLIHMICYTLHGWLMITCFYIKVNVRSLRHLRTQDVVPWQHDGLPDVAAAVKLVILPLLPESVSKSDWTVVLRAGGSLACLFDQVVPPDQVEGLAQGSFFRIVCWCTSCPHMMETLLVILYFNLWFLMHSGKLCWGLHMIRVVILGCVKHTGMSWNIFFWSRVQQRLVVIPQNMSCLSTHWQTQPEHQACAVTHVCFF